MRILAWALLLVAACTPSPSAAHGDDDSRPPGGEMCASDGTTRCSGQEYQTCTGGTWQPTDTCASDETCFPGHGCAQCDPTLVRVCHGNDVYACADGQLGGVVESCAQGCADGVCNGDSSDDCDASTQVIYVVDKNNAFLSFDPRHDANTFHPIGTLNCPAGSPYPAFGFGPALPYSMTVDRQGRAWVLYTSGEIFLVDTHDASCQASGYHAGQNGFEMFGMGFVSDAAGGQAETLYISGGKADVVNNPFSGASDLGSIDASLASHKIGPIVADSGQRTPSPTGNGNGELWAYFPGSGLFASSAVARLDKATGARLQTFTLPAETASIDSWAFAHYGGRYYIFVEAASSRVLRLDPLGNGGAGQVDVILDDTGRSMSARASRLARRWS